MTRAPRSASWRVANGPAMACSSVTTVRPSSGNMGDPFESVEGPSAQRRDGVHGQPALVVLGPQADRAVVARLTVDLERVEVEGRAHRPEAEGRDVGARGVAPQQVQQQRGEQRAVNDQTRVALDL